MSNRLNCFLGKKNNLLYEKQYRFRQKRPTEHAVLDIVMQIQLLKYGPKEILLWYFY